MATKKDATSKARMQPRANTCHACDWLEVSGSFRAGAKEEPVADLATDDKTSILTTTTEMDGG
jgi:hypothetical protein